MIIQKQSEKNVILLTGMSGSGKSSVLKFLEDLGYETIDNLPLSLLFQAVNIDASSRPLVIDIDTRTRDFNSHIFLEEIEKLKKISHVDTCLTFLECDVEIIQKRYRETRRHHPLSSSEETLPKGILKEKNLLEDIKKHADIVIDTSLFTPPELKERLQRLFELSLQQTFKITLLSFAFPRGVPREADVLFDMRFLKNPYYSENLKRLTGESPLIKDYLKKEKTFQDFSMHFKNLLEIILPCFKTDRRDYFTIAFGCTGGQHRSVFTAEEFENWLKEKGYHTYVYHRDIKRV